jgi:hypothetical protein
MRVSLSRKAAPMLGIYQACSRRRCEREDTARVENAPSVSTSRPSAIAPQDERRDIPAVAHRLRSTARALRPLEPDLRCLV